MNNRGGSVKKRRGGRGGASPGQRRRDELLVLPREEYAAIFSMGGRKAPPREAPLPAVHLIVSDRPAVGWKPEDTAALSPAARDPALGASQALPGAAATTPRELVMGLDFGTSSTKVVLADRALNAAYAVPLTESVGVAAYLLPSAMVETVDGCYLLAGKGRRHADLKLSMLANMADMTACARVCAFLALVIRSARAWLYEAKREQYLRADLLWSLALGQPASQAASAGHRHHYKCLAEVAWVLAGGRGPIRVSTAEETWRRREQLDVGDDLEVRPMAELSAQVHGFVSSSHFDARQPNIYLMVDVGAGTVDATLFHVRKERAGAVSFSFFTHTVEALGAANFNRHRLNWWQSHLATTGQSLATSDKTKAQRVLALRDDLERLRLPTEYRGRYPELYNGYVKGVEASFSGGARSPDAEFQHKVRNQVAGQVLYRAWKEQLLTQDDVKDMPFFLCGGGARHPFYAGLKTQLQKTPNCTWLTAQPRALALPANIVAPGVVSGDYDRLSVAYGLSQLNPGAFDQVAALKPVVATQEVVNWTTSATDKSVC